MIRPPAQFFPARRHGLAADAAAVLLNLFLFPIFASRLQTLFDRSFADETTAFATLAALMLFALAGRLGGLYLKRLPLRARLAGGSLPFYFFVFNAPVLALTAAFVAVLLTNWLAGAGWIETGPGGRPPDSPLVVVFGVIFLTGLEIYLLYRLSKPLSKSEKEKLDRKSRLFDRKTELLADFGLFAYMMIWQVFYSTLASMFLTTPGGGEETFETKIFSLVFLFFAFLLFYVSPRTVFLVEDRRYWGTWLFVLFVFLSSLAPYW